MRDSTTAQPPNLASRFVAVRRRTLELCRTLEAEDMVVQPTEHASPVKWHLAHTTWFFETFVLARASSHVPYRERWNFLFNSYYNAVGAMQPRACRGLLTRPTITEVFAYRVAVDEAILLQLERGLGDGDASNVELGIHHEEQHQELILMDAKLMLWSQPLRPAFRSRPARSRGSPPEALRYVSGSTGLVETGALPRGFAFDNERPRHLARLIPHALGNRLVTNAEYEDFIRDGGYRRPALWLSEGWNAVKARGWEHPLYWSEGRQLEFTLDGMTSLDPAAPVVHVSFFEADAFARWADARLPTEFEWESAAQGVIESHGNFLEGDVLRPLPVGRTSGLAQLFGDLWEWTSSPYVSYPGYRAAPGALGEYNGKFMSSQWVLRGGSCVTPASHIRRSYRNFFMPADRWQFAGIRLAVDE